MEMNQNLRRSLRRSYLLSQIFSPLKALDLVPGTASSCCSKDYGDLWCAIKGHDALQTGDGRVQIARSWQLNLIVPKSSNPGSSFAKCFQMLWKPVRLCCSCITHLLIKVQMPAVLCSRLRAVSQYCAITTAQSQQQRNSDFNIDFFLSIGINMCLAS